MESVKEFLVDAGGVDVAYSYIRFSSRPQEMGDSIRRQMAMAKEWAERKGIVLDTSLRIDRGVSAFRGLNADLGSLGEFLRLVEAGRVRRGSYLVVESLDRLSRNDVQPALRLILGMLAAGVRIVQLSPVELIYDDRSDAMALIIMIMELMRSNSESKMKSERGSKAWSEKRNLARDALELLTRQMPGWMEVRDGRPALIPRRAAAVKRIFQLAAAGYSCADVIRCLNNEGIEPFGEHVVRQGRKRSAYSGRWLVAYVGKILRDRRVLGEYQPRGKGREPDGPPIPGYFPAAITEQEWHLARAGCLQRNGFEKTADGQFVGKVGGRQGRRGDGANLFSGLLRCATDGGTYFCAKRPGGSHLLVNAKTKETTGSSVTFPYEPLERAMLWALREIDPSEVVSGPSVLDSLAVINAELAQLRVNKAALGADLLKGYSATIADVVRQLEQREQALVDEYEREKRRIASPLDAAWQDTRGLLAAVDSAENPADVRIRLRSVLARIVESVSVLVVPRGYVRLCAVQMWFSEGDAHRDYLIYHRRAYANQKTRFPQLDLAGSLVRGISEEGLDLRNPDHAFRLQAGLEAIDLDSLVARMTPLQSRSDGLAG